MSNQWGSTKDAAARRKKVLALRKKNLTFAAIGKLVGLSGERCRQISERYIRYGK